MITERTRNVEKFAFVGAASVGKSTMTDIYKRRFAHNAHVVVLEEGAQIFFQQNSDSIKNGIHVVSVQEQLQDFVIGREQEAYQPGVKMIITDRSIIDPIIYTHTYQDADNARRLFDRVADWVPTYSHFFLLDPTGVPQDKGPFRRETLEKRFTIYDAFQEFFTENALPFEVVSGTVRERVKKVDRKIYECIRDKTIFESNNKGNEHEHTLDSQL